MQAKSEYFKDSSEVLPVQINGKTRGTIVVNEYCSKNEAFRLALEGRNSQNIWMEAP